MRTVSMIVVVILLIIGGIILGMYFPASPSRPRIGTPGEPSPPQPGVTITPADLENLAAQIRDQTQRIDAIDRRLATLQERVDRDPPGDQGSADATLNLKSEANIAQELSRNAERMADLGGRVETLERTAQDLSLSVEALQKGSIDTRTRLDQVASAARQPTEESGASGEQPGARQSTPPSETGSGETRTPTDVEPTLQALMRGVELLGRNEFTAARDVAGQLREGAPNDARVWYLSALANGYVTNQWRGETETMVSRGVELERAGMPEKAQIDRAFASLPDGVLKWLNAYRQRAR